MDDTGYSSSGPENPTQEHRRWAMAIHLAQFSAILVPVAGIVVPIVIWVMKRDESRFIEEHGRIVINWLISAVIYALVTTLLFFVVIGIPLAIALGLCLLVFPIIGAIKALDGVTWEYPLTIRFL